MITDEERFRSFISDRLLMMKTKEDRDYLLLDDINVVKTNRRLVKSYKDLILYLLLKDPESIRLTELQQLEGKNIVLYSNSA